MAAALLLRAMHEPSTPKGRLVGQGLQGLLEHVVVQNAKFFASQHHSSQTERSRNLPPPREGGLGM
jgi:hypothetical protein